MYVPKSSSVGLLKKRLQIYFLLLPFINKILLLKYEYEVECFKFWLVNQVEQSQIVYKLMKLNMMIPVVDSEVATSTPQSWPLT